MNQPRFSLSSAVVFLLTLTAISLPAPASALQLYSRTPQVSSSAVANRSADSVSADAGRLAISASSGLNGGGAGNNVRSSSSDRPGAGLSGKVFARFLLPQDWLLLASLPGDQYPAGPRSPADQGFQTVFTMRSFGQKVRASLNGYRLGYWPAEKGRRLRTDAYRNPDGFIEVTRENEDTRVSEHFRLRDFLSHGQANVWPKYLVLREPLLDKLELVIEDLNAHGINAEGMRIQSGFRTPAHNSAVRGEGSARDSRHQFGDAVDVFLDQEGTGRMSDLNGDGRVNFSDVKLILAAVERVEARYPELVGGTGLYTGRSGSFAHIDVRGHRARWVRGVRRPRSQRSASSRKTNSGKVAAKGSAQKSAGAKSIVAKRVPLKTASAATSRSNTSP